jgi:hypothetical protein
MMMRTTEDHLAAPHVIPREDLLRRQGSPPELVRACMMARMTMIIRERNHRVKILAVATRNRRGETRATGTMTVGESR